MTSHEEKSNILLYIGDFSHFFKEKLHFNIGLIFYVFFAIISLINNLWNYEKDIEPTFLKPFEMISGLVSPKSIVLTNELKAKRLIRKTRLAFRVGYYFSKIIKPLSAFLVALLTYALYCSRP
jgi:hypothetical protein